MKRRKAARLHVIIVRVCTGVLWHTGENLAQWHKDKSSRRHVSELQLSVIKYVSYGNNGSVFIKAARRQRQERVITLRWRKRHCSSVTGTSAARFCFDVHPHLLHDPLLVVVAQRAAQLVVVHRRSVLLDPPPAGHLETGPKRIQGKTKRRVSEQAEQTRVQRICCSLRWGDSRCCGTCPPDLPPGPGPPPQPPDPPTSQRAEWRIYFKHWSRPTTTTPAPPPAPGSPPSSCLPVLGEAPWNIQLGMNKKDVTLTTSGGGHIIYSTSDYLLWHSQHLNFILFKNRF